MSKYDQNEAQIRELIEQRAADLRAGDAEQIVARFEPDTVNFTLAPPLRYAGPDVTEPDRLQRWFATFDGPVDYEVRDLTVIAGEEVAFGHSLNRLSAAPQGSTEKFTLWFRSTIGLRKLDGTWRIVHEHESTPFYMDGTFAAALDLQP